MRTRLLATLCITLLGAAGPAWGKADTQICHKPGTPAQQILAVNHSAVPGHLGHGDHLVGPEICDGVDNDCDGVVDDLPPDPTACGVGACQAAGELRCEGGAWIADCQPGEPTPEICDGLDNDCDGEVD
ncbi:MAG: putative metal-binding motif-containing protein, partial [Myxococcales bacterium]|nr:putative metal-binding motif-containing protein [Myxococcales bacterium]